MSEPATSEDADPFADDCFNRKPFAEKLTDSIINFTPLIDQAYVLSLNAKYGAGKTKFLKMWRSYLIKNGHKVIYINAWETDFDDEPLVPIACSLIEGVNENINEADVLKGSLKAALAFSASMANQLVKGVTTIDFKEAYKDLDEASKGEVEKAGNDLFNNYKSRIDIYKSIKTGLKHYLEKVGKRPLIIFVDELDRVRPDYAVKFLESIKHIFSTPNICFVIAADKAQLKASISHRYGFIDFENYYLRFATREVELKEATKCNLKPYINKQMMDFFDLKKMAGLELRIDFNKTSDIASFIEKTARAFAFTPRQILSLFRSLSQLIFTFKGHMTIPQTQIEAIVLLLAIKIHDPEIYEAIGNQAAIWPDNFDDLVNMWIQNHPRKEMDDGLISTFAANFLTYDDQSNDLHYQNDVEISKICEQNRKIIDHYRTKNSANINEDLAAEKIIKGTYMKLGRRVHVLEDLRRSNGFIEIYNKMREWHLNY